mgnify:CR=1 FL=1
MMKLEFLKEVPGEIELIGETQHNVATTHKIWQQNILGLETQYHALVLNIKKEKVQEIKILKI